MQIKWNDRPNRTRVPMNQWSKSHWSTLAYVEDRTVNDQGLICWDHLTVSHANWPFLFAARARTNQDTTYDAGKQYPLVLRSHPGGTPNVVPGHCEVDALMDMVDAGLIKIQMPKTNADGSYFLKPNGQPLTGDEWASPKFATGFDEARLMAWASFSLTERGREIANELRAWKASGEQYATFEPKTTD
ncbi:hypothetical protein ABT282_08670 [Streptomyces sp. NPDC000927]|uniref:hypothetical protein n=1 Tax=Streptomyces sp. NPDC000927 TaxID=3154371 RepID=UPI003330D4BC